MQTLDFGTFLHVRVHVMSCTIATPQSCQSCGHLDRNKQMEASLKGCDDPSNPRSRHAPSGYLSSPMLLNVFTSSLADLVFKNSGLQLFIMVISHSAKRRFSPLLHHKQRPTVKPLACAREL